MSEGIARIGDVDEEEYRRILVRRDTLRTAMERFFQSYVFLMHPDTPTPAFEKNPDRIPMAVDADTIHYWDQFDYPMYFNATGHPALTVRLGLNEDGLHIAVQVVGPRFSEARPIHFTG